jgi:transposase
VDRGRPGSKRHLLVDGNGTPLVAVLTGAQVHDSKIFEQLVDGVEPVKGPRGRPRKRPEKLHADKGYDFQRCRRFLRRRGIKARIARRAVESSQRLGRHRWVVERTLAWLSFYRRLCVRYERRADIHEALLELAAPSCASNACEEGYETVTYRRPRVLKHPSMGLRSLHGVTNRRRLLKAPAPTPACAPLLGPTAPGHPARLPGRGTRAG